MKIAGNTYIQVLIVKIWVKNKNCAQEIRQVKVPQLALPQRAKTSNCRYTLFCSNENLSDDLFI